MKKCLNRKSNQNTLIYKGTVLPLSYPGRQFVSIISIRDPVRQTHLVYHADSGTGNPKEMPLNNGRHVAVIIFLVILKKNQENV